MVTVATMKPIGIAHPSFLQQGVVHPELSMHFRSKIVHGLEKFQLVYILGCILRDAPNLIAHQLIDSYTIYARPSL